jgi:regulator of cell morphogenesis and NO signaling
MNAIEGNPVTVAQLAISQPGAVSVFTRYDIDYCCGGHRTLEDACRRKGLDPEKIEAEIMQSERTGSQVLRPENWSASFLADYIVQNHHTYVRKSIPEIQQLLDKVCEAHGTDLVELIEIRKAFLDLAEELMQHMEKEETILFPAIRKSDLSQNPLPASALRAPVGVMEREHAIAGDLIKQIRALSDNYTAPEYACPTFQVTYQKLQEFDTDLMQHIHLENNVLFPRFKANEEAANSCSL